MDTNEIVRALRCCANKAERFEACHTGQPDCPYGETIIDCTERMHYDAANSIESLQTQLAESQRREKAAVEDLTMICISGETCAACAHCCNKGDQFPCAISDEWCFGEKWQWRGPEEGEEK